MMASRCLHVPCAQLVGRSSSPSSSRWSSDDDDVRYLRRRCGRKNELTATWFACQRREGERVWEPNGSSWRARAHPDEFGLDALACIVAVGHQFGHAAGIPSGTSGTRRVVRLERQGGFRCLALLPLRQRQRRSPVPSPCVSDRDAPWDFISPASPASSKHKLVCEDADKGDDRQRPSATIGNGHRQRSARAIGKSHRQRSATAIGNDRQEPSAATWLRTALRPHEHRPSPRFT